MQFSAVNLAVTHTRASAMRARKHQTDIDTRYRIREVPVLGVKTLIDHVISHHGMLLYVSEMSNQLTKTPLTNLKSKEIV